MVKGGRGNVSWAFPIWLHGAWGCLYGMNLLSLLPQSSPAFAVTQFNIWDPRYPSECPVWEALGQTLVCAELGIHPWVPWDPSTLIFPYPMPFQVGGVTGFEMLVRSHSTDLVRIFSDLGSKCWPTLDSHCKASYLRTFVPQAKLTLKVPSETQSDSDLALVMSKKSKPRPLMKVVFMFLLFFKPYIKDWLCLFR